MPLRTCPRHGKDHPRTRAMGNLYRFVEPVLPFLPRERGRSYGYQLAGELRQYAPAGSGIEVAALYRTLRQLEENDCVTSEWDVDGSGPASRLYTLTPGGKRHLKERISVLDRLSQSMNRFVEESQSMLKRESVGKGKPSHIRARTARRARIHGTFQC